MIFIAGFILVAYISVLIIFIFGWNKVPRFTRDSIHPGGICLSIVVCCKNESESLPVLIDALLNQQNQDFELVWVDDHSMDETLQLMKKTVPLFKRVQILQSDGQGKKEALKAGVGVANGEIILTTDADCIPSPHWVNTILSFYAVNLPDMIIAPVKMTLGTSFFSRVQQLEFSTLVASGMAAAGAGMPLFCNAANMAFTKKIWDENKNSLHEEKISGDDVFLLLSIKKNRGKIVVLKSENAMVLTRPAKDLKSFIQQRRRWLSKSSAYRDFFLIFTGLVVALVNVLMIVLLVIAVFVPKYWCLIGPVFMTKLIVDVIFLRVIRPFFRIPLVPATLLVFALIYPFYVLIIGVLTLFGYNNKW